MGFLDSIGWTKFRRQLKERRFQRAYSKSKTRITDLFQSHIQFKGLQNPGDLLLLKLTRDTGQVILWRFVKTKDWYEWWETKEGVTTQLPLSKPPIEHYLIGGIPVSVGMTSDEFVEAMIG